jgi:hypothetical protein
VEKISKIIPASTRQVWISGEVPKPRRMTEPNPVESEPAFQREESDLSPKTQEIAKLVDSEQLPKLGGRIDLTA